MVDTNKVIATEKFSCSTEYTFHENGSKGQHRGQNSHQRGGKIQSLGIMLSQFKSLPEITRRNLEFLIKSDNTTDVFDERLYNRQERNYHFHKLLGTKHM